MHRAPSCRIFIGTLPPCHIGLALWSSPRAGQLGMFEKALFTNEIGHWPNRTKHKQLRL